MWRITGGPADGLPVIELSLESSYAYMSVDKNYRSYVFFVSIKARKERLCGSEIHAPLRHHHHFYHLFTSSNKLYLLVSEPLCFRKASLFVTQ